MGGHPWQYCDRYRDKSPFFFLDRVTAPVLLLHGGSDMVVSPETSIQTFVALRSLGKDVKLVIRPSPATRSPIRGRTTRARL
jgi:dipeptidyl aminopeptidase/acylaminoacyl peptidase